MLIATHVTVRWLTRSAEGVGRKLHMNIFFFFPDFYDLHARGTICYGTVGQDCKGMLGGFDSKALKLRWGDTY